MRKKSNNEKHMSPEEERKERNAIIKDLDEIILFSEWVGFNTAEDLAFEAEAKEILKNARTILNALFYRDNAKAYIDELKEPVSKLKIWIKNYGGRETVKKLSEQISNTVYKWANR